MPGFTADPARWDLITPDDQASRGERIMKESTQVAIVMAGIAALTTIGLADSSLAERVTGFDRYAIARCLYTPASSAIDDDGSVTTWLSGGRVVSVKWLRDGQAQILAWNEPCTDDATITLVTPCADVSRGSDGVLRATLVNGRVMTIDAEDDCPSEGE